jgi:hypothetical protein
MDTKLTVAHSEIHKADQMELKRNKCSMNLLLPTQRKVPEAPENDNNRSEQGGDQSSYESPS